jgi:hypothetical protein
MATADRDAAPSMVIISTIVESCHRARLGMALTVASYRAE